MPSYLVALGGDAFVGKTTAVKALLAAGVVVHDADEAPNEEGWLAGKLEDVARLRETEATAASASSADHSPAPPRIVFFAARTHLLVGSDLLRAMDEVWTVSAAPENCRARSAAAEGKDVARMATMDAAADAADDASKAAAAAALKAEKKKIDVKLRIFNDESPQHLRVRMGEHLTLLRRRAAFLCAVGAARATGEGATEDAKALSSGDGPSEPGRGTSDAGAETGNTDQGVGAGLGVGAGVGVGAGNEEIDGKSFAVLVAGEHWASTTGQRTLGLHCSLAHVGQAYADLIDHFGRDHVIVIAQLESTIAWLREATASGLPLYVPGCVCVCVCVCVIARLSVCAFFCV